MSNFFNKTPYTDFHELNLDWLLERVNNIKDHVKGMQDDIIYLQEHTPDMDDYYDKTETDTLLADKADVSSLATVATTGDYDDLINKPSIPAAQVNSDWSANSGVAQILNKPTLATVATSGDYDDLINKPSIPAAQVNSDWNANSGVAQILNKPTLATVATSGSYSDLSGRLIVTDWQSNSTETATANTWSHINGGNVPTSAIPDGFTIDNLISLDARSTNTSGWSRIVANIRASNSDQIAISVYSNIALAGNQIHYRAIWYK